MHGCGMHHSSHPWIRCKVTENSRCRLLAPLSTAFVTTRAMQGGLCDSSDCPALVLQTVRVGIANTMAASLQRELALQGQQEAANRHTPTAGLPMYTWTCQPRSQDSKHGWVHVSASRLHSPGSAARRCHATSRCCMRGSMTPVHAHPLAHQHDP